MEDGMDYGYGDVGGDDYLSSSAPNSDGTTRTSRLARKAESARQARLRHKQFVDDLQKQASVLQARIRELEAHCTVGPGSAKVALGELKGALSVEQLSTLTGWLKEAQGDDHVLARYEKDASLPPSVLKGMMPPGRPQQQQQQQQYASAPISIGGTSSHWRGGASPMESDENCSSFPLSRSWDDIEGARSILNLNSPNGFHPLAGPPMPPPTSFSLPTNSMGSFPSYTSSMGSMMNGGVRNGVH